HLDLMERRNNYKICQWNVWEPLPKIAPLLPAARPEEAPPREVAGKDDTDKGDKGDAGENGNGEAKSASDKPSTSKSATKKGRSNPALFQSVADIGGYCAIGPPWPPPCRAICELNGESPFLGSSTTTMVPTFTRLYRSIASSLVRRMQPEEIDAPIYSGWLVPWIRNSVSLPFEYRYIAREPIGLSGPCASLGGSPRRVISPAVGCHGGH